MNYNELREQQQIRRAYIEEYYNNKAKKQNDKIRYVESYYNPANLSNYIVGDNNGQYYSSRA